MLNIHARSMIGELTRTGDAVFTDGYRHEFATVAIDQYLTTHGDDVPLLWRHDPDLLVGTVRWFEKSRAAGLVAVASIESSGLLPDDDRPLYLSPGIRAARVEQSTVDTTYKAVRMHELSLVPAGAYQRTEPVRFTNLSIVESSGGTITGPNFTADRKIPDAVPFSRAGNQLLMVVVMLMGSGPSAMPRPRR